MGDRCDICCGSGTIRLPRHSSALAAVASDNTSPIDDYYRTYPCPECNGISDDRLAIIGTSEMIKRSIKDPAYKNSIKHKIAVSMASYMLEHDLISFKERPRDDLHDEIIARTGIASKERVASLDQRVAEKQFERMGELLAKAEYEIRSWRRDFDQGRGAIEKDMAVRAMRKALEMMRAEPTQ